MHVVYKSRYLRAVETTLKMIWLLLGRSLEAQTITTTLIQNYHEMASDPLQKIVLTLSKPIETYSASILLTAHFRGLAWFMYHWLWTTGSLFVLNIMLVEVLLASYVWDVIKSCYVEEVIEDSDNDNATVTEGFERGSSNTKNVITEENESSSNNNSDSAIYQSVDIMANAGPSSFSIYDTVKETTDSENDTGGTTSPDGQFSQSNPPITYEFQPVDRRNIENDSSQPDMQGSNSVSNNTSTHFIENSDCFHVPQLEFGAVAGSLAAPSPLSCPRFEMNSVVLEPDTVNSQYQSNTNITASSVPASAPSSSALDEIDMTGLLEQDDDILLQ